jgi:DNA-binding XRE family transcriptional regulator
MDTNIQTITVAGLRFVLLPEAEYFRLSGEPPEPDLPPTDADGNYPAREALRVVLARKLIRGRRALGWTQAEFASRAGVRVETLNRLEHGKHSASAGTVDKLWRALDEGEAEAANGKRPAKRKKG